jgi:lysophospholipase L1-like esterase
VINARLKGGGYYQIAVDGKPTSVIFPVKDPETYEIARGLPAGEHVVEIVRRNEGAWITPITFLGFELEKGSELVPLSPRSERRLLIVGDSISCGYGNEATRDEGNPPAKQNGYMTYGAIAARKLGAEAQIIAWSGRTLFPNNTMVEVFPRTLAMDAEPKFDQKSWVPGVVVIDLGTNDFRDPKRPPEEKGWISAYKSFIASIRKTAPDSYVFVASGPMGTAANWDQWAKTVVADLQKDGDQRIAYLPFATQDVNGDGIGGHWHPNLTTQGKMADRLTREIEKAVGWK